MKLTLIRQYSPQGTPGKIFCNQEFLCYSLERPNLNNQTDNKATKQNESSCIPEGKYQIVKDTEGKFKYFKVLGVNNRSNIEIHPANNVDELSGCIGVGKAIINDFFYQHKMYKFWLFGSKLTCKWLLNNLPKQAYLEIISINT